MDFPIRNQNSRASKPEIPMKIKESPMLNVEVIYLSTLSTHTFFISNPIFQLSLELRLKVAKYFCNRGSRLLNCSVILGSPNVRKISKTWQNRCQIEAKI